MIKTLDGSSVYIYILAITYQLQDEVIILTVLMQVVVSQLLSRLADSCLHILHLSLQVSQLLVQNGQPRASGEVERVQKFGYLLYIGRDGLDELSVVPVLLYLALHGRHSGTPWQKQGWMCVN